MPSQNIRGDHLFLLQYKASKAIESYDHRSVKNLGFRSISDFAVLEYLKTKGPQPVNTIAQSMMLTSGSMTTAIDRAEKRGLVTRKRHPEDRRVVIVSLTGFGQQLIDSAFEEHAANLERLFSVFTREEKSEFARLIKKIGKTAEAMNL
ncbi:MarR family transcriptional regulator [Opitutaceae bacterium]|jgi:MarR family 2-MHQ and catechol resistance regulon transcriptional repressor|nr:MarR family transcriptional regulator [Opitutaceae bacterium]